MKLYNNQKKVTLNIPDLLIDKLSLIATKNCHNESGGFLVGSYSDDLMSLNITDFILPQKQNSTKYSFRKY